jgi:hypothetical protein
MGAALDTLLTALARTPGDTCEAKMEKLIADGEIWTPNLDSMRGIARGIDRVTIIQNHGWLEDAMKDIQVSEFLRRLRNVHCFVSLESIRAHPEIWNADMVASQEEAYRISRERPITPHRRRTRVHARKLKGH